MPPTGEQDDVLLTARVLTKRYPAPEGGDPSTDGPVYAVHNVSFELRRGTTTAVVGETGSGKTTLGRLVAGLEKPTSGEVVRPRSGAAGDSAGSPHPRRLFRRGAEPPAVQMVFQNAYSSLNRRHQVFDIITRPLKKYRRVADGELEATASRLLDEVGLGADHLHRFPGQLSSGQCQRVAIAQALAVDPPILVLDEPTSNLDLPVQARILNLLLDLQRGRELSFLFITHDLAVAQHMADEVLVMRKGRIVEAGAIDAVLADPRHPFTRALLAARPDVDGPPETYHCGDTGK